MPRARPPMRRGLKRVISAVGGGAGTAARAAPYEKGTETNYQITQIIRFLFAARAAPYEKGTETIAEEVGVGPSSIAARAAPYEKGTETFW